MIHVKSTPLAWVLLWAKKALVLEKGCSMCEISRGLIFALICVAFFQGCSDPIDSSSPNTEEYLALVEAKSAAIEVNERQTEAFNSLDAGALAAEFNYPTLRLDIGQVQVFATYEIKRDISELIVFPGLIAANWDHSAWEKLEAVQVSPNKVHVSGRFSRFDIDGNRYAIADTLRIVTKQDDHWGIKISSSYIQSTLEEDSEISEGDIAAAEGAAKQVVDQYMKHLNNRDSEGLADLNHYPLVVLLDVDLDIYDTLEDFIVYEENNVFPELDYTEWDHSELSSSDVIHSGADKIHLAIKYIHFNVVGEIIGKEEGIWVVTKLDDQWRVRARSML